MKLNEFAFAFYSILTPQLWWEYTVFKSWLVIGQSKEQINVGA